MNPTGVKCKSIPKRKWVNKKKKKNSGKRKAPKNLGTLEVNAEGWSLLLEKVAKRTKREEFKQPCRTSLFKYKKRILADPQVVSSGRVANKSQSRFASEGSERSAIAYAMTVCSQHFWEGKPVKGLHSTIPKAKLDMHAEITVELVQEMFGSKEIQHVLPGLLTSTDATTTFATCGQVGSKGTKWVTVTDDSDNYQSGSYRSKTTTDRIGDAHKRGLRVELNTTFNALTQIAPFFCTVYGLSESEMPAGEDIVLVEVEGLVNGSHQVAGKGEKGFLCFVRGKKDVDVDEDDHENLQDNERQSGSDTDPLHGNNSSEQGKKQSKEARVAKIYREKVYYPFIRGIRTNTYNWDGQGEVPKELTAVCWMDGANGQISLTTTEDSLQEDEERKIRLCKHSAARSAVEQMCDVQAAYRILKALIREITMEDIPISQHALKRRVHSLVSDHPSLQLQSHKLSALVDFCAKLPVCGQRAFLQEIQMEGFYRNGQIDRVSRQVPNIFSLLGTKKGSWEDMPMVETVKRSDDPDLYNKELYRLHKDYFRNIFGRYFMTAYRDGHIPESMFNEHQVAHDRDSKGNIVERNFEINLENRQRAKVVSSKRQRIMRVENLEAKRMREQQKKRDDFMTERQIFSNAKKCEELVKAEMERDPGCNGTVETKHFGQQRRVDRFPTMQEIRDFVKIRSERTFTKEGKPIYKAKGKNRSQYVESAVAVFDVEPLEQCLKEP